MVINIVELLIEDSLKLYRIRVDKTILEVLSTFYSFPNTRILGIQDGQVFIDDVIRLSMPNGQESFALIESEKFSDYYSEEVFHEIFNIAYHTNLILLAVETGIPLARLTCDYKSFEDLNPSYIEKLKLVKETINPVLDYLVENNLIELPEHTYDDKIREFLSNAIN